MESSTASAPRLSATEAPSVGEALRRTAAAHPDVVAVRTVDDAVSLTWSELLSRVEAVAAGLVRLGVGHGDTVGVMLKNRPEFHVVDLAAVTIGAVPFSVYNTSAPEQIAFVAADADTRVIITEQAFLPAVSAASRDLPHLEHIVLVDDGTGDADPEVGGRLQTLAELEAAGTTGVDIDAARAAVGLDDVATLIYTSGTTGPPKGVELTHRTVLAAAGAVTEVVPLPVGARVISWLPAAHIAERMAHHYIPTVHASTVTVCPDPREISAYLPQVRPHWFFAVPRVWEKLKAGLEAMLAAQTPEQRAPLEQALAASLQRVRLRQRGEPVPAELEAAVQEADATLFSPLRTMLGFDQLIAVNVGAAPTAVEVIEFFHALGIEVAELWGMSETAGAGTINRPAAVRIGTVGPPTPGVEAKLGEDGELLIRGDVVMRGYRHQPEKTAETLEADGWLHTGDIATIDDDGYVRIVDRKKELIINAGGKNMSPANIEAALKAGGPIIGQVCVIGDRRPYNTALIVLDPDFAPVWATQHGLGGRSLLELADEPAVREAVQEAVDAANARLSRVEQIKRFVVLGEEWAPGGDELTPTMKLKRRPIGEKYADTIDALY